MERSRCAISRRQSRTSSAREAARTRPGSVRPIRRATARPSPVRDFEAHALATLTTAHLADGDRTRALDASAEAIDVGDRASRKRWLRDAHARLVAIAAMPRAEALAREMEE